jgi:ribonuclease BN (tRNA processing enzyme)
MWEEQRTQPLTMLCQKGLKNTIRELIEYGYQGFTKRLVFPIEYVEVQTGQKITYRELELQFASTHHSVNNLAIKITDGERIFCYSGDGQFTPQTEKLYSHADLVIHDAYTFDKHITGHSSIKDLVEMARKNNIKCLALTHFQREIRQKKLEQIKKELAKEDIKIIIPSPYDEYP